MGVFQYAHVDPDTPLGISWFFRRLFAVVGSLDSRRRAFTTSRTLAANLRPARRLGRTECLGQGSKDSRRVDAAVDLLDVCFLHTKPTTDHSKTLLDTDKQTDASCAVRNRCANETNCRMKFISIRRVG